MSYEITSSGPDHAMVFTATAMLGVNNWGAGDGSSKKAAEAAAAEVAVKAIRTIYPDYRR